MKDFVKESWKIGAAFAAGAFLLSLLIGLITRNPFGTVVLRAFLLALLFAVLGAGLRYLVRTYLPELAGGSPNAAPADEPRGSRVDIVVDDEIAPGAGGSRRPAGAVAEEAGPAGEEPADAADTAAHAESEALGELAEELAEDASPAGGAEAIEEAESGGEQPPELLSASANGQAAELDELPDIESLDGPGKASAGGVARRGRGGGRSGGMSSLSRSGGTSPDDAMKETMARQDPATLARALRTVLKKDEKG